MQAIVDLAQENGGMVTTAQVVEAGISRARISDMVKAGELVRVQRGVYCLADAWEDDPRGAAPLPQGNFLGRDGALSARLHRPHPPPAHHDLPALVPGYQDAGGGHRGEDMRR